MRKFGRWMLRPDWIFIFYLFLLQGLSGAPSQNASDINEAEKSTIPTVYVTEDASINDDKQEAFYLVSEDESLDDKDVKQRVPVSNGKSKSLSITREKIMSVSVLSEPLQKSKSANVKIKKVNKLVSVPLQKSKLTNVKTKKVHKKNGKLDSLIKISQSQIKIELGKISGKGNGSCRNNGDLDASATHVLKKQDWIVALTKIFYAWGYKDEEIPYPFGSKPSKFEKFDQLAEIIHILNEGYH